jgi:hypothetical protein
MSVPTKALSFFGGVVVAGAAVAALIAMSPSIRGELEHQSSLLLSTTRDTIEKGQELVYKLQKLSGTIADTKGTSNGEAARLESVEKHNYDAQWADIGIG